ncbi:MAG: hypothetical protein RLZ26_760 [Pseudomonadota bacterium]
MSARGRVCALSMARNPGVFARLWLGHYGRAFGAENCFLILDGADQALPEGTGANILRLPHRALSREAGDRRRAGIVSDMAAALFAAYDVVVATDIDEMLILDPAAGADLGAHLMGVRQAGVSALGIDIAPGPGEGALDPAAPVLHQRRFGVVNARYTKPVVATRPVRWGAGLHRMKGRNFRIDPALYLLHLGLVDGAGPVAPELAAQGWGPHAARRAGAAEALLAGAATAPEGAAVFELARRRQSLWRPIYAWNKPGRDRLRVIRLPEAWRDLL